MSPARLSTIQQGVLSGRLRSQRREVWSKDHFPLKSPCSLPNQIIYWMKNLLKYRKIVWLEEWQGNVQEGTNIVAEDEFLPGINERDWILTELYTSNSTAKKRKSNPTFPYIFIRNYGTPFDSVWLWLSIQLGNYEYAISFNAHHVTRLKRFLCVVSKLITLIFKSPIS